jgi:hypothetical protein
MSIEVRIQKLLLQIETESFRLCRVESHPAFKLWLSKEPRLSEGLASVRRFWKIFCDDASPNDPLIPQYIELIEKATTDLAQSLDLMYRALGFEQPSSAKNPN